MKPSTYFSVKSRLKDEGYGIPNIKDKTKKDANKYKEDSFLLYIKRYLLNLNWKDANKRFEQDMFRYLFQQYGFQRRRMEKILQISYPSVWLKLNVLGTSEKNTMGLHTLK